MADTNYLVEAAMRLRGEAPAAWETLLEALKLYQSQVISEMVRCQPDMLPRAQGMSIAVVDLLNTLRDAPKIYEKIRKTQGHG
jgi:hypothetical protein